MIKSMKICQKKVCLIPVLIFLLLAISSCAKQSPKENTIENTIEKETEMDREKEEESTVETEKEEISAAQKAVTVQEIYGLEAGSIVDAESLSEEDITKLFYSEPLPKDVIARINGVSYQENPYIGLEDLRYLRVLHFGFDGKTHVGELIVNERIAGDTVEIMRMLYENSYPIEKMILVEAYHAEDEASMSDNNTSAFNYRMIPGSGRLSEHGKGLAIDINPKYNPCVRTENGNTVIEPANGADYADRGKDFSYKIGEEDLCCKLFKEYGFTWGGDWRSLKDYQHFEKKE